MLASYNEWDQILPEHVEGPIYEKAQASGDYIKETAYARAPTTPGLYDGPYIVTGYTSGAQIVLEPNPYWAGTKPGFKRIVIEAHREHGGAAGQSALGRCRHGGRRRRRPHHRPGARAAEAASRPVHLHLQAEPHLRAYRFEGRQSDPRRSARAPGARLRGRSQDAGRQAVPGHAAGRRHLGQSAERRFRRARSSTTPTISPRRRRCSPRPAGSRAPTASAATTRASACRSRYSTTAGNRLRELQQQVLQSNWKAACIEVTIKNEPARTFFGETVKKRDLRGARHVCLVEQRERIAAAAPCRSTEIPTEANNYGGSNYIGYSQPANGQADRRRPSRSSIPASEGDLGQDAGDLREGPAGHAALLPRRAACRAEMARRATRRPAMATSAASGRRTGTPNRRSAMASADTSTGCAAERADRDAAQRRFSRSRELTVAFPIEGRERRVVAGVSYSLPAGPHARRRRRIGLRQVDDGARADGARALAGQRHGLAPLRRARAHRPGRKTSGAALRGARIAMVFQEPMTSLNPVMPVGRQIAEAMVLHQAIGWSAGRARRRSSSSSAVGIPSPQGARRRPSRISSPAACGNAP